MNKTGVKQKCVSFSLTWAIAIMIFTMATSLKAQNKVHSISGVVTEESGGTLPGVSVLVKGGKLGTVTGIDGDFMIAPPRGGEIVLVFKYIGYETQEVKVKTGSKVKVTMKESHQSLDELVVIGYGVSRKSDLTGALASVKSDAMEDKLVVSVEDGLRGKVAGVNIISTDGAPGADLQIRIRGTNSLSASNSPLYVIDGVLTETCDIGPGEIENMEILKDASATAIYGSRGANGVVLITTKKGQKGKSTVSFQANVSVQQPVRLYEMMNSNEYAKYRLYGYGRLQGQQADYFDMEGNDFRLSYAGTMYNDLYNQSLAGILPNTDWQQAMLRDALVQDYRLTVSGGDDKGSYSIMGGYLNQPGIIVFSDFERYNVRLNMDRKVNKNLTVGVNVSGNLSTQNSVVGNVIQTMLSQPPSKTLNVDEWEPAPGEEATTNNNPYLQAQKIQNTSSRANMVARGYFDLTFAKIFRLNVSGSYSLARNKLEQYYPSDVTAGGGKGAQGRAVTKITDRPDWLNENILYITPKAWGKHSLDAMAGMTFQGFTSYALNSETNQFINEELGVNNMGYGLLPILTTNNYTNAQMVSFLGRVNYRFNDRYLLTLSIRSDGSSRLGEGHKWGYFPSGAFAWRASEEEFIKNLHIFSNLKLRASFGVTGNTGISPYQTLAQLGVSGYPMNGTDPSFGLTTLRLPNPLLRWETTYQADGGIDFGFFKNRLTATVDYYYKRTKDLLLQEPVPSYLGYGSRWTNRGIVDNQGLEVTVEALTIRNKNFSWSQSLNLAFNRSNVVFIGESGWMIVNEAAQGASGFGIIKEGMPIGQWYGYKNNGVFTSQSQLTQSGVSQYFGGVTRVGYPNYEDVDNNKAINEGDRQIIGQAPHLFTGGYTNTFNYKGIGLQVGLEFKYGGSVFNATRMSLEGSKGPSNQTKRAAQYAFYPTLFDKNTGLQYVQGNEDIAYLRTPVSANEPANANCNTLYIEDASYLRINDVTLSYNLPSKYTRMLFAKNLRFFVSCKNAFVFTRYTGYDPDVSSVAGSNSDLLPNVDNSAYPRTRAWSFGLNATF